MTGFRTLILSATLLATVALAACTSGSPAETVPAEPSPFVVQLSEKDRALRTFMAQPKTYFATQLQEPPVEKEGQILHPKLQYEIEERQRSRKERGITDYNGWMMGLWSKPEGRKWLRDTAATNWVKMAYDAGPVSKVQDYHIDGPNGALRVRVYWPEMAEDETRPVLLYFHGGAFLIGSIEAVEPQMQILVKQGEMIVVSVDYALAPEHVFPAAHKDALAAWNWLQEHVVEIGGNPNRIGVGGDSAGANIAITVANEQIKAGKPVPKAQLLYYPFTDSNSEAYGSFETFGNGYGLDKDFIRVATKAAVADPADLQHPWLRVVHTVEHAKQPPAIIVTAGFDPIRDQGIAYAKRLKRAGVNVDYRHYPSLNHGFLESSGVIDDAYRACVETARDFGRLLKQ
ncbi:MAG TPA: hypothetical protein DIW43_13990 [Spongiibacteraceae bacterium]|nr:hypothetical protein [Spongiibacteraceae bacterium]MBN51639.1 hypothetical protein [Spongiibacteraceae bacterium]HCS28567.1 hypothetical protein [Spongiibacteraceae bacterium]